MGKEVAHQDAIFAVGAEGRPVRGDRVVEVEATALDLLPEGDRRERLGAGEEREEGPRPDRLAPLGVGEPAGKVEDEPAVEIDRERRTGEEPHRAELLAKALLDLDQGPLIRDLFRVSQSGNLWGRHPTTAGIAARSRSTSTRRRILPEGDFGIWSTNSSRRTFLYGATRSATNAISSSAVASPRSTTNAFGTSPASSSGEGMTAASATAGCAAAPLPVRPGPPGTPCT